MTPTVTFEASGGLAVITIDRPQVRNAVDRATADALATALDELDARDDVTVGVLTGAGGFFSAGMDLKAFSASGERPISESRGSFGICGRPPEKPLIAAVEGKALGGGFEIALACDWIVAAVDAAFGLPEVRRGLVAAAGGLVRLPQRIPRNVAMEMVITGESIGALRAQALGLVNAVATSGEALDRARVVAEVVAVNAPLAVKTSKRVLRESALWPDDELFERQAPLIDGVRNSEDAKEGARAFVEKRPPVWHGR
jgi:enoyl-CoA hydratase/carnithine racemase